MFSRNKRLVYRTTAIMLFLAIVVAWRIAWAFPRDESVPVWSLPVKFIDVHWRNGRIGVATKATGMVAKYPPRLAWVEPDGTKRYWSGSGKGQSFLGFAYYEGHDNRTGPINEWRMLWVPCWPFALASGLLVWWVWRRTGAASPENAFPIEISVERDS